MTLYFSNSDSANSLVRGTIVYDEDFNGYPYCGSKGFYICNNAERWYAMMAEKWLHVQTAACQVEATPHSGTQTDEATNIPNRTSIHERPSEADGHRFGDFEMDLIVDSYGYVIFAILERFTEFVMMERMPYGKRAKPL